MYNIRSYSDQYHQRKEREVNVGKGATRLAGGLAALLLTACGATTHGASSGHPSASASVSASAVPAYAAPSVSPSASNQPIKLDCTNKVFNWDKADVVQLATDGICAMVQAAKASGIGVPDLGYTVRGAVALDCGAKRLESDSPTAPIYDWCTKLNAVVLSTSGMSQAADGWDVRPMVFDFGTTLWLLKHSGVYGDADEWCYRGAIFQGLLAAKVITADALDAAKHYYSTTESQNVNNWLANGYAKHCNN